MDLSEFYSAGYFITKAEERPGYASADLLPDQFISLCNCICKFFPSYWAIEWSSEAQEKRIEAASYFGITEDRLDNTISEVTKLFDIDFGWENVIFTIEAARNFLDEFIPNKDGIVIIGAALHNSYFNSYMDVATPPEPEPGKAPIGAHGTYEVLTKKETPAQPTKVLGFEPIVYNYGLSCCWLCNGLEKECFKKFNIKPNSNGLIDNASDASKCVTYIQSDEVGAEPGLWLPWLLLQY